MKKLILIILFIPLGLFAQFDGKDTLHAVNVKATGSIIGSVTVTNLDTIGALGSAPGSINFDTQFSTMNIRQIFANSSLQVGQEMVIPVRNLTGDTLFEGDVVHLSTYDSVFDMWNVECSIANSIDSVDIDGMVTIQMLDSTIGLITTHGRVNNLDTRGEISGSKIYVSPTERGKYTTIKPVIPVVVGKIGEIDSLGWIEIMIIEEEFSVYGGFSSLQDVTFSVADSGFAMGFNSNDEVAGITHNTTGDSTLFIFESSGVYQATVENQLDRTSGTSGNIDTWFQLASGNGFFNIQNTNIKRSSGGAGETGISPLTTTIRVGIGDTLRVMNSVEATTLFLNFTPEQVLSVGDTIPNTPSSIFNIIRVGN